MRVAGLLLSWICFQVLPAYSQKSAGSLFVDEKVQPGYTLFTSLNTTNTYLIDNCGRVINKWESAHKSGSTSYLMNSGNLVRAVAIPNQHISRGGGGGAIEIMKWNSDLVWYFEYNSPLVRQHHDILPLDNGNILVLAWSVKSLEASIAAGRNPALIEDGLIWSEEILEVKPIFPNDFQIVWRWDVWDHLVQDHDASKNNYGVVSEHPELIDVNFVAGNGDMDWIHANGIDYNPLLNQIMICTLLFNEFWVIDHSTTTVQAASHTGGRSGKGGDILYRWGNPRTYKKGTEQDKTLGGPHNAHWIKYGLPSAGSVMVFNNNAGSDHSAVEIINPPVDLLGKYTLQDGRFGPAKSTTSYKANPPKNLMSRAMSGAQMQPNGNVLICSTLQGRLVELTPDLDTAWLYKSPITLAGIAGVDFFPKDANFPSDPSFRAMKYLPNHLALREKDLTAGALLEGGEGECDVITGLSSEFGQPSVSVYPNPVSEYLFVDGGDQTYELDVKLIDLHGRELLRERGCGSVRIGTNFLPDGFFIVMVNLKPIRILKLGRQ